MSEILEKVGLKTCSKCEQTLPVSAFGKNKNFKDGLRNVCKVCRNKHNNQWVEDNRDYVNEQKRQRYENNREHINEQARQWYQEHREELLTKYNDHLQNDPVFKRKTTVRQIIYNAIKRGELIRPDACPQCGANDSIIEAHHWSYELGDELDVLWLCHKCHMALHRRNKID